jgi:hypothetical protein
MKSVKSIVQESPEFYNGISVGIVIGLFVSSFLINRGNSGPIIIRPEEFKLSN